MPAAMSLAPSRLLSLAAASLIVRVQVATWRCRTSETSAAVLPVLGSSVAISVASSSGGGRGARFSAVTRSFIAERDAGTSPKPKAKPACATSASSVSLFNIPARRCTAKPRALFASVYKPTPAIDTETMNAAGARTSQCAPAGWPPCRAAIAAALPASSAANRYSTCGIAMANATASGRPGLAERTTGLADSASAQDGSAAI